MNTKFFGENTFLLIAVFSSLVFCQSIRGQAYFLEKDEGRMISSVSGSLDQNSYGIGASAGIIPGEFIDIRFTAGKKIIRQHLELLCTLSIFLVKKLK